MSIFIARTLKILTGLCLFALISACNDDSHSGHTKTVETTSSEQVTKKALNARWERVQNTDNKIFSAIFSCQQPPHVGGFQVCHLVLEREGKLVSNAKVSIDGGMKVHGHGLPTSPQIEAAGTPGQYLIKGLKFSMPGQWIVGFKVDSDELTDQVIFAFSI